MQKLIDVVDDYIMWIIFSVCIVALGLVIGLRKKNNVVVDMRDITMSAEARWMHVRQVAMERVCDGILEAVIRGEIEEDEANILMAEWAKYFKQPDMVPIIRKKKPIMLKAQLRNNKRRRKLRGKEPPLPLPEPDDIQVKEKSDLESIFS